MSDMLVYGTLGATEYSLINMVRNYPVLYNPQDPGHHDRGRIDATWAEIGRQLNKEKEWCFSKWANLLDDYKKRKAVYNSMGASVTMMSWLQYDALNFLDVYQNPNGGQQNGLQQRDNTSCPSTINQNPAVHGGAAPPAVMCYTNGIPPGGQGHPQQQHQHHPPLQVQAVTGHQGMMVVWGMEAAGIAHQVQDSFLPVRTVFKCPTPTCVKTFPTEEKLQQHVRTKQCLKFNQNGGGGMDNGPPKRTKKQSQQQQQQDLSQKYADENMRLLPSSQSSGSTTTNNSSDLEQTDNSSGGSGGGGASGSSRKGGKNSTRVTCSGCGRSFQGKNSKYALKKHYQSHYHDGPSSWGFTCNICGKKCQFQFKLDEHMRTHSKEQPFECDQCGRKFSIKFNLKRHIKLIHKIETPYLKSQNMKNA